MITRTEAALAGASRPLRRSLLGLALLGALAGFGVVMALAAWSARAGLVPSPVWVPAAWLLAIGVAGAVLLLAARRARGFGPAGIASRLEQAGAWRNGSLRSMLDTAVPGTSDALHTEADQVLARDLSGRASTELAGERRRMHGWLRLAAVLVVLGVGLLGAAGTRHGPAALLWRPAHALAMVVSPLRLSVDRGSVKAGNSVSLQVRAPGRRRVTLWTRSPGTTWSGSPVTLDSVGHAVLSSGPLTEALFAHVTEGSRSSDTLEISVKRPAFLAALALTIRYPAYLGLEDEPAPVGGDTLLLPVGSRLEARGEATVALREARWAVAGVTRDLGTDGTRFSGAITPTASGAYRLVLLTEDGEALGGEEVVVPVRLLPDLAPILEIPVPGGDTTAPASGSLPVVIDARDDHGLTEVVLERWVLRAGARRDLAEEPLPLPGRVPDRAILPASVDVATLGLKPGDTLRVQARGRDNSPARQVARSRELSIVVPTLTELREEGKERTAQIARQLDSLAAESRKAQRQSEDLGREQQRTGDNALDFEAAKKAEAVADRQEDLIKQAEDVQRSLEELRKSAERAGLSDSAFQQALRDVQEQLDQALSPELRRQLAELQEALKALDRERTRDAVRRLSESQQKLRDALERSRELFKRAALEGQLATLEQEAKELAQQQQEWSEQLGSKDSAKAAADERAMSKRADSIAAGLHRAAKELSAEERRAAMEKSANDAKDAAREMQQAAQQAERKQQEAARQTGQRAAAKMNKVQEEVREQREGQQQEWREEVVAQLDRALLETTRLSERQLAVTGQFRRGTDPASARALQGAIEEGVQKLLEQVGAASGKNALVSPQILAALAEARQQMTRAREAAASASGNQRETVERAGDAVDALNVAAFGLLRSRDEVSGASSGSGFAEAMERMTRMANQQGQISQDANGMLPMMGNNGMQQQLQQLAARQRALAQELERLRAQGQLDVKPLSEEAQELARAMERGRLDREMVSRQERLFRRMLDAGRTLQGQEQDEQKERQSESAKPGELRLPPALRAELLGRNGEIRLPTWDQLQRLSPEERRLVTEYFRRLTGGSPR